LEIVNYFNVKHYIQLCRFLNGDNLKYNSTGLSMRINCSIYTTRQTERTDVYIMRY